MEYKLHNEDCLTIFEGMEDSSVDLFVTDCPYHIVSGGCTNDAVKIGRTSGVLRRDSKGNKYYKEGSKHVSLCGILNDYDPTTYTKQGKLFKYNDIAFDEWLPSVYRILKEGTHCYIMINPRNLKELWIAAEKAGFEFQNLLVWDKGNGTPNKYYMNAYEIILMLRKGRARNINDMGTKNILRVSNILGGKKVHPTEKPVELMKILVANSSNEGDLVMDSFMGAGSTGVACKELNRDFIGVEIDSRYFDIAKERMSPAPEQQMTIFDYLKG